MNYTLDDVLVSRIDVWDEAQARKLDSRGVVELAKSIRSDGLQNPPLVQKNGDRYTLISGQRRLAAIKSLGKRSIPVLILQSNRRIENAKASSLVENIHRRGMNASETAKAVRFIVQQKGKKEAGRMLGMSMRTVERHLGFDAVPDSIKEMVPKKISRDHAIKLSRCAKNTSHALELANKISKYDEAKRNRYIKALTDNPNDPHDVLVRKSNQYYTDTFKLGLPSYMMKKLALESEKRDITPEEMVSDIVKRWLANR